jgi:hypothetical protein
LGKECKFRAAIEGFGVDPKEIDPELIELWVTERMKLDWKCKKAFEGLNWKELLSNERGIIEHNVVHWKS